MLLLSDATVMVQNGNGAGWFRLMSDSTGGYTNGIWTNDIPAMAFPRKFYSSDILPDGRVFVAGGEHPNAPNNQQQTNAQVFNPLTTNWTVTADAGGVNFSDSESVILPNGNVLVHPVSSGTNNPNVTMIYNPGLDSWTVGPTKIYAQTEESWVKLPDESILTIGRGTTNSERYIPSLNLWIKDADVPVKVYTNFETGAAFLLPNGRAFFLGATGHTALYTATGTTNMGSWAAGPDIPDGHVADDVPAAMMVNGRILCAVGGYPLNGGTTGEVWFCEYDYSVGSIGAFALTRSPTNSAIGASFHSASYNLSMLDLPDGTVLMSLGASSGQLYVYQPDTSPLTYGKPTIDSVSWNQDGSLHLTGKLFNGISEGSAFGDDAQEASNYPIVRLTDVAGNVTYARTFNWSSTSVMTSNKVVTTEATLPASIHDAPGKYSLAVIANGVASDPATFYGPVWVDFNFSFPIENGTFSFPYSTLAEGTNAVPSAGTIALNAGIQPSDSTETLTISKPMTIISVYGPSTIGH